MNAAIKTQVHLTDEQRNDLLRIARDGKTPARKARLARVLLHADADHPEGCRTDAWIGEALGMHINTIARLRKLHAKGGIDAAFARKPREIPAVAPKIDGHVEAHLVAIHCGPPPEGRARWTLRLLARELKGRGLVTEVCIETVRKTLKKTS